MFKINYKAMAILLFLLCIFSLHTAYAVDKDMVVFTESLNINKVIKSDISNITISIPAGWKKKMAIDRDLGDNSTYTEKYNIYYKPEDEKYNKLLIMEIFIYKNDNWTEQEGARKIASSSDYTAAVSLKENPFTYGSDKVALDNILKDAGNDLFMKTIVTFEGAIASSNVIYVNGKVMKNAAYSPQGSNVVYIPIREVCEALGYTVTWRDSDQSITVSKQGANSSENFSYVIFFGRANQKYHMIKRDGMAYVTSAYFLRVLKCDIVINERNNVKIVK